MSDIAVLLSRLADHWLRVGAPLHGPARDADLAAFEGAHGVRLPADVRAYFECVGGMVEGAWDDELVRFWALSEVRTVAEELAHQEPVPAPADVFFCFADYSIWCHAFAVRLGPDPDAPAPVAAVYGGNHLVPVAPSFSSFLERYLAHDLGVLFPEPLPGRTPQPYPPDSP